MTGIQKSIELPYSLGSVSRHCSSLELDVVRNAAQKPLGLGAEVAGDGADASQTPEPGAGASPEDAQ